MSVKTRKGRTGMLIRKKNLLVIVLFTGILLGILLCMNSVSCIVSFDLKQEAPVLAVNTQGIKCSIEPWDDPESDIYYYFLPSYVTNNQIFIPPSFSEQIIIDGIAYKGSVFEWIPELTYHLEKDGQEYDVRFMRSANLHTVYLTTENNSLALINEDKEYEENGFIKVVNNEGILEYNGKLNKLSARGNSTFAAPKKSYSIILDDVRSICNLEAGKKWNLLAQFDECDKIHTRLVFDMAKYLNMEYTPDSAWIDLYCDGKYLGLYLLTEAVTVGDGRVDIYDLEESNKKYNADVRLDELEKLISGGAYSYYNIKNEQDVSGGFLIEKSVSNRIEEKETFFTTELYNYCFTIKSPRHTSKEQIEYIREYVQRLEDKIAQKDAVCWEYVDIESLSKQYLIDKISLNKDAMWESTFYYKERGQDLLKAGPLWDYDLSFGAIIHDYSLGIEEVPNSMAKWYNFFYSNTEFKDKMKEYYCELLPHLSEMIEYHIDEYADWINAAREMDAVVNKSNNNRLARYRDYDNHVRYLKYFLAGRVNYLNDLWEIEGKDLTFPKSTEEYHKVCYWDTEGQLVYQETVKDGEPVLNLPDYDPNKYDGWHMYEHRDAYVCDGMIPIYEDTDFYLKEK